MVNVSLTLFQCSLGNEAERLLTVMKSRSPKVHRRRMHFRRSSRLSALAVRPGEKNKREKRREDAVLITAGWESGVLEFNSARNYIGPRRLFARGLSEYSARKQEARILELPRGFVSFVLGIADSCAYTYIYVQCISRRSREDANL